LARAVFVWLKCPACLDNIQLYRVLESLLRKVIVHQVVLYMYNSIQDYAYLSYALDMTVVGLLMSESTARHAWPMPLQSHSDCPCSNGGFLRGGARRASDLAVPPLP